MKQYIEKLKKLLFEDDGFLILLRLGKGFDNKKYLEIDKCITELSKYLEEKEVISKELAGILFDLPTAMESTLGLYKDEEEEKIIEAMYKLEEIIRDCLN